MYSVSCRGKTNSLIELAGRTNPANSKCAAVSASVLDQVVIAVAAVAVAAADPLRPGHELAGGDPAVDQGAECVVGENFRSSDELLSRSWSLYEPIGSSASGSMPAR